MQVVQIILHFDSVSFRVVGNCQAKNTAETKFLQGEQ